MTIPLDCQAFRPVPGSNNEVAPTDFTILFKDGFFQKLFVHRVLSSWFFILF